MFAEHIQKYLRDFSSSIEKKSNANLHIKSSLDTRSEHHQVDLHLSDKFNTLNIKIIIPNDKAKAAKIYIRNDDDIDIDSKIGNSRNVPLEHDMNTLVQIISESSKQTESVLYIQNKLTEIFAQKQQKNDKYIAIKKIIKMDEALKKETLEAMIQRANIKGAGIKTWYKTPNHKVVLKYNEKENESYGSELEANTHLYYAYLLKNKKRSTRRF